MFTRDQIEEIKSKLIMLGTKDTQFPDAHKLNGEEIIAIVQDGENKKIPLSSIINDDFINVSKDTTEILTLSTAVSKIDINNRKLGQIITFKDSANSWAIRQFTGSSLDNWNDISLWKSISGIDELKSQVETNAEDISVLSDEIERHDASILNLNTDVSKLKDKDIETSSSLSELTTRVDTIKSQADTNTSNISSLNTEVSALQSKVDVNTASISQINTELDNKNDEIAQINNKLAEHTESINANITTDRIEGGAVTSEKISTTAFDDTLSLSGKIAPADVVGEKITELEGTIGQPKTTYQEIVTKNAYDSGKFSCIIPRGSVLASFENYDTKGSIQLCTGYPPNSENLEKRAYASDLPYTLQNDIVAYKVDKTTTNAKFNFFIPPSGIYAQLAQKVNKEIGKGLSSNDFTDEDKEQLSKINDLMIEAKLSNLINQNDKDFAIGKYLIHNGSLLDNSIYNTTGFIPVEEGNKYSFIQFKENGSLYSLTFRFLCFYNASKEFFDSKVENQSVVTIPSGCSFVRLTFNSAHPYPVFVKGENPPSSYIPYVGHDFINTSYLEDNSIGEEKLSIEVQNKLNSAYIAKPNGYTTRVVEMQSGRELEFPRNSVKNRKTIAFSANITSLNSASKIVVGHGQNAYQATWLELDDVNMVVKQYTTQESVVKTIPHGLTISNNIQVKISQESTGTANISIVSDGVEFSTTSNWHGCNGKPFARIGGCALSNCSLGWYSDTIVCDNWLFGDSYFSLTSDARWTSYLIRDGHKNNMLNAHSGEDSATALVELQNLLQLNKPKRIVWCMGMNDLDTSSSVNANWKSAFDTLEVICTTQNIELILSTIPSVIGGISNDDVSGNNSKFRSHKFKNAIVRASGYRYIDFDKAVGASEETGLWFGTTASDITEKTGAGMLSSDGVHPTSKGAKALYYQAIADCPEIATL